MQGDRDQDVAKQIEQEAQPIQHSWRSHPGIPLRLWKNVLEPHIDRIKHSSQYHGSADLALDGP
jgi:hypothetical protein